MIRRRRNSTSLHGKAYIQECEECRHRFGDREITFDDLLPEVRGEIEQAKREDDFEKIPDGVDAVEWILADGNDRWRILQRVAR